MSTFKKGLLLAAVSAAILASGLPRNDALAGSAPTYTLKERLSTIFSVGIQWDFSDSQPQVVASVRRLQTRTSGDVAGGKFDIALPLTFDKPLDPTIRLMGVVGNRDIQGEAGAGWKIMSSRAVAAVGVQAPYTNGGVNYVFGAGLKPYLGVNTFGRAPGPRWVLTSGGIC